MFKHILIPTDGSPLAAKGARTGVRLARALGAKVTGVFVIGPYIPPLGPDVTMMYVPGIAPQEYEKAAKAQAAKALAALEREARAAEVRCRTQAIEAPHPWQGILKAARAGKCDAIAMASHGRSGLGGLILGSETSRVLAHSKITVIVAR